MRRYQCRTRPRNCICFFARLQLDLNRNHLFLIVSPRISGFHKDLAEISGGIKIRLELIQGTEGIDITGAVGEVAIKHLRHDDVLNTDGLSEKEEGARIEIELYFGPVLLAMDQDFA